MVRWHSTSVAFLVASFVAQRSIIQVRGSKSMGYSKGIFLKAAARQRRHKDQDPLLPPPFSLSLVDLTGEKEIHFELKRAISVHLESLRHVAAISINVCTCE